jgi:hypothetical protein
MKFWARRLPCRTPDAFGQGDDGEWPAEPSFLALGITRSDAEALGRRYQQNAIPWIASDCLTESVTLVTLLTSVFVQD